MTSHQKTVALLLVWTAAAAVFAIGLLLSLVAVNLKVSGIPVRAIFITLALTMMVLVNPTAVAKAAISNTKLIAIVLLSGLIGFVTSMLNKNDIVSTIIQLIEIQMQAIIGLLAATLLIDRFGLKPAIQLFLLMWLLTAIFALGQAVGFDISWQVRGWIGDWMNDPAITRAFYDQQQRAVGLSFTPVHLATQTCLAFAAFFAWRFYRSAGRLLEHIDWPLLGGLAFAAMICVISGNRSPLLGFAAFLAIYLMLVAGRWRSILLPLFLLVILSIPLLQSVGQALDLRIASSSDGSAVGRSTLWNFGIYILAEQPLGYGLLFDSTEHAAKFVHQAVYMDNPDIIRHFSLHNYYLLVLNKYGLLLLLLVPWILPQNKIQIAGWLGFSPYLVHIAFHNDGPLNSDFLIWMLLPVFFLVFRYPAGSGICRDNKNRVSIGRLHHG